MPTSTIIDDRDPTVSYKGTWAVGGTSHENAGTVSSSLNVGDSFTVPFTGTNIAVYGTFDSSSAGVKTSYAIDGGAATTVTSASSSGDSWKQLFWQSDALSSGDHKLVVTMVSVNNVGDGEGTVWFDYFDVSAGAGASSTPSPSHSSSSSGSGSLGTSAGAKSTASVSSSGSSSSATSTSAPATVTKSHSHTGVIAGVIVLLLLLALAVGVFFVRRRRRQQRYVNFPAANMSAAPMGGPPSTQHLLANQTPMSPMSSFPGSSSMQAAPYGPSSGGFDPHALYAAGAPVPATYGVPAGAAYAHSNQSYSSLPPQGPPAQAPYDPFASPRPTTYAPTPSYAASLSSAPSSQARPTLSVVGGTAPGSEYSDSIAELKRRQQQVVNSYEQGISSPYVPPMQHVDSGVRDLDGPGPSELPPVYTPH